MFSLRLNISIQLSKPNLRSYITDVNNVKNFSSFVKPPKFYNDKTFPKIINSRSYFKNRFLSSNSPFAKKLLYDETVINYQAKIFRGYCNNNDTPNKADVFGELGDRQFEKVEMDEDEKKEEDFVENEARVPRGRRLTPGGYANLIKSHIQKRDLTAAVEVLDLVANNRDKPTTYMYNLLLRAYAIAGDFKKARSLYAQMKKHGLQCNAATYTSILNACANYHHSETALDYLDDLRVEFAEKNVVLNETHYNTMIKAYGRHGKILEAFLIADEMRDKRLPTDETTFNSLLNGTISDKEAGLRHALTIWSYMHRHKINPSLITFNLLLRAIRDTKLGNLKVNDVLISAPPVCQVYLDDSCKSDLLKYPPTVNSLIFTETVMKNDENSKNAQPKKLSSKDSYLPATIDSHSNEKSLSEIDTKLLNVKLDTIHEKNRLILFGGVNGILESMARYGVVPDTKSITLLMELVPGSNKCEDIVLSTARSKKIPLDLDFFNMLMKKKSFRADYKAAKGVLDEIQRCGLCPDIITWGILALGCHTWDEAKELIDAMEATGHRLNEVIAGTLINNACHKVRFSYVLRMMEIMTDCQIQPNWELYVTLDKLLERANKMIRDKNYALTVRRPSFKHGYAQFKKEYPIWREQMEREKEKFKKRKVRQR